MAGFCTLNFLAQYCYFSRWMIRQKKIQENDIFTEDKRAGQSFGTDVNQLKARREKYKVAIQNFMIMSDTFMRKVFQKKECAEYVLQVIMEKPDLQVREHVV